MTLQTHLPEYQNYLAIIKDNLKKYQNDVKWYFGGYERGYDYTDTVITVEMMAERARAVSPVGDPVDYTEVIDITPPYSQFAEGTSSFAYDKYQEWVSQQTDAFYYARGREVFSMISGYKMAASLGYRKVIFEDLS